MLYNSPFLSCSAFQPHPYEDIREGVFPSVVAASAYDSWVKKFRRNEGMESYRIEYMSDACRVAGLYLKAKSGNEKKPVVLFNRGGRGRYGMINVLTINNLLMPLVERDYVVLASQYRGVDGGQGEDEFGGAEVQDIVALYELATQLPEWDGKNIYMFGWSRGGMMTLLALKAGVKVNAVALGAPLVDLTLSTGESTKREAWLQRVLPNYEAEGFKALERRSATYWLNKVKPTPILAMHGDADEDVSILHSRQLVQKLKQLDASCKLVEYEGGNHYLNRQREEVMQQVDSWFRQNAKAV